MHFWILEEVPANVSSVRKISWIMRPKDMTVEEWQIALRHQVAKEEYFGVTCVDETLFPGE